MTLRILRPKVGKEDELMQEIVLFMMTSKETIIEYPVIFVQAWASEKMKVFAKRGEDGAIVSMCIISVFENPVDGMKTYIESFTGGEEDIFQECVKFLQEVYPNVN